MHNVKPQNRNPHFATREIIERSRQSRAAFDAVLTITLLSASAVLIWINVGVLSA